MISETKYSVISFKEGSSMIFNGGLLLVIVVWTSLLLLLRLEVYPNEVSLLKISRTKFL